MKTVVVILFLTIGCFALFANSTPIKKSNDIKKTAENISSRQAAIATPAAAADDEDDDDDDEDDIASIAVDEDDDDDDDEDDDDDDDDIIERLFEGILGDDDDDDDDDVKPVEPLVQAASPVQTLPASVQSDLNSATVGAVTNDNFGNQADAAQLASGESGSVEDEDKPQEQSLPVGSPVENSLGQANFQQPIQLVAVPVQAPSNDDDDDDDDDDEEDLDIDITGDEDSDEDDDDDDEDDDDGDDLSDLAGARAARGMESPETNDVSISAIYVAKYNRFVDNILSRINNILEKKYNPVMVRLSSPASKSNKSKTNKKSKKNKTKLLSRNDANTNESTTLSTIENQKIELNLTESSDNTLSSRKSSTKPVRKSNKKKNKNKTRTSLSTTSSPSTTTTTTKKPKLSTTLSSIKKKQNNNKTKKLKSRARATLYGLPTLKRSGDVSVNMMSNHTTIRTKFSLGPLILKVEKEFGRSNKKELRSATATTAEMSGKLSLRVLNGGAATLHSIRVLQPKQVRIDSKDDHDRTREFVWRRSSHIAHVVSQKLSSATRSMLRPPPLLTTTSTTATTTSPLTTSTSPPTASIA